MLFAYDIVLVDEIVRGVNAKLEMEALELKDFKIWKNKTKYMKCKFNVSRSSISKGMKIQNQEISKNKKFRYLGSIFSKDGKIIDDITHRIQVGCLVESGFWSIMRSKNTSQVKRKIQ